VDVKPIGPEASSEAPYQLLLEIAAKPEPSPSVPGPYVPFSGGETSTLNITSFTDFALAGNRGKDRIALCNWDNARDGE
jgi:hypothetical protein